MNNSRRNISLGSAAMMVGSSRPKTAAMAAGGLPRPPTAFKNTLGNKLGGPVGNFMGQRAVSA